MSNPAKSFATVIESDHSYPDEAIILAGGQGTRLRQLLPDLPKPLAPVAGRPFLTHLLDWAHDQELRRVILSVGYKYELIQLEYGDDYDDLTLDYAIEESPRGTAGGIRMGLEMIQGSRAFVLNGDTLFDVSLPALVAGFDRNRARMAMAVKPMPDCKRYGAVRLDGDRVVGFQEKGLGGPGMINGGVFLLDSDLGAELDGCFSFETDFLQPNLDKMRVAAVVSDGFFIDIGVPEDFAAAQTLLAGKG